MKWLVYCLVIAAGLLLCTPLAANAQWCDPDEVIAQAEGGTIIVNHNNAEWNCCSYTDFLLVENGYMLDLYETEVLAPGCWCTCCFDLIATIEDVEPGDYLVRCIDAVTLEVFGEDWVTVEGSGGTRASLGGSWQSPCGGWASAVPDDPDLEDDGVASWGAIKTLYR